MSDFVQFDWDSGLEKFLSRIKEQPLKMQLAIPKVLFQEAEELMAKSKPLVPVDHGFLRASGHVNLPEKDGDKWSVQAGYGGVAGIGNLGETNEKPVGYAIIVHENLEARHNAGTQAKFLEQPFEERKQGIEDRITNHLKEELGI